MSVNFQKRLAAGVSVMSNSILISLKFFVGFLTGSISIISEAIHSASDLLASFLALFSVSRSSEPADVEHPFGHGKYEDMSGFLEGLLIFAASFYIFYEAGRKLLDSSNIETIDTSWGIAVMGFSVLINVLVSKFLFHVAKKTESIALFADAEHLKTDIYSSFAVLVGLLLIKITGNPIFDPVLAIIVGVLILSTGYRICKTSLNNLLDGSLPEENKKIIETVIKDFYEQGVAGYKNIKTRRAGAIKIVEITLKLPCEMTICRAHSLCDAIEQSIEKKLGNTDVIIHPEPACVKVDKSLIIKKC